MMSPYLCWSARSFSRNTAGINSDSRSTSAMMALPQETILRIAWPQRLFSARKSSIVTVTRYSTPRWWEWLTGLRVGVCGSWGEARTVDRMAAPLKEPVLKKEKWTFFFKKKCVYMPLKYIYNSEKLRQWALVWGKSVYFPILREKWILVVLDRFLLSSLLLSLGLRPVEWRHTQGKAFLFSWIPLKTPLKADSQVISKPDKLRIKVSYYKDFC